jgi:hypothetical protein
MISEMLPKGFIMREFSFQSLFHHFYANKLLFLAWMVAWLLPWGSWLAYDGNIFIVFLLDMLRLSLALGLFLLPGILLYWLILPSDDLSKMFSWFLLPIGFVFSTLMVSVLGLLGRVIGMPFGLVKALFALVGFLGILLLQMKSPCLWKRLIEQGRKPFFLSPFLVVALLFVTLMNFNGSFLIDDFTYLAYLTHWQHVPSLDFREVIFGTLHDDPARFWFSVYPMTQALLSDLSGIPGVLLLGNYLEFYLMPVAVFALYFQAHTLRLSRHWAGFAVLAHIILLAWIVGAHGPTGTWFYQSMSADKVSATFIFMPVLLGFSFCFFETPDRRTLIFVFLTGLAISVTHPVILFIVSLLLAGIWLVAVLVKKVPWHSLLIVVIFILVWTLPYIGVRLSGHPSISRVPYSGEQARETPGVWLFVDVREDGLYTIPLELLNLYDFLQDENGTSSDFANLYQVFRGLPWGILLLAGLIAAIRLRAGWVEVYLAVSTAVISLALIPHTAWILGLFTSARLLSRVAWFAPLGLSLVFLIILGRKYFVQFLCHHWLEERRIGAVCASLRKRALLWTSAILLLMGLISPLSVVVLTDLPAFFDTLRLNQRLVEVGYFLGKNHQEHVVVVTLGESGKWDNYLPGLSHLAVPVSFRGETHILEVKYFFSLKELIARKEDSQRLRSFSPEVTLRERLKLLEKYDVRYVLAGQDQAQAYALLLNRDAQILQSVYENELFVLFSVSYDAVSMP